MHAELTGLPGLLALRPDVRRDERGYFVKTFQRSLFDNLNIDSRFDEHFFSSSHRGVIRGMHFQEPPEAQSKVVFCASGTVLDVVVDLRTDSPTYQKFETFELSDTSWAMLVLPIGCAHGFAAISESATMGYLTSTEHSPAVDAGIRWNSFGFEWPFLDPIISDRDRALPTMESYSSQFRL